MNVFVTGSESGIGRDITLRLLSEGHSVYACHYQDLENIDDYEKCVLSGQYFFSGKFDVTNDSQVISVVDDAIDKLGRVDAVINVAGIAYFGNPESATIDEWEKTFDINVHGYFRVLNRFLPHLKNNKDSIIINTSSIWGKKGNQNMFAYASSKHAVEGMTKGLQEYCKNNDIKVTSLVLDKVDSNFRSLMEEHVNISEDQQKKMLKTSDISDAVMYVLNTSSTSLVSSISLDAYQWR